MRYRTVVGFPVSPLCHIGLLPVLWTLQISSTLLPSQVHCHLFFQECSSRCLPGSAPQNSNICSMILLVCVWLLMAIAKKTSPVLPYSLSCFIFLYGIYYKFSSVHLVYPLPQLHLSSTRTQIVVHFNQSSIINTLNSAWYTVICWKNEWNVGDGECRV